jgi:hypothetical protein
MTRPSEVATMLMRSSPGVPSIDSTGPASLVVSAR